MPAINPIELSAVVLGVLYVLLAARGNTWCWLSGIGSALFYIVFAWQKNYYLDMVVQVYYVLAGGYGWYSRAQAHDKNVSKYFQVNTVSISSLLFGLAVSMVLVLPAGYYFSGLGNAYPYLDAATTIFSFYATWLTIQRVLYSWLIWVFVDVVMAVQYTLVEGYMTTGLYLFFTVMAVYGYWSWKQKLQTDYKTSS